MSTPSSVKKGTDPSGQPIATYDISESAETRKIQRVALVDPVGTDYTTDGTTGIAPGTPVSVSTTAASLVAANSARRGVILFNNGPNALWIGFTNAVLVSSGLKVFPGGSFTLQGIGVYRGAIWGICATSESADVRTQEW